MRRKSTRFSLDPRSHPQNSSDFGDIWAGLQAVRDDRFQPVLDCLAHALQSFPHPVMAAYGRIADVLERLDPVAPDLHSPPPPSPFRHFPPYSPSSLPTLL